MYKIEKHIWHHNKSLKRGRTIPVRVHLEYREVSFRIKVIDYLIDWWVSNLPCYAEGTGFQFGFPRFLGIVLRFCIQVSMMINRSTLFWQKPWLPTSIIVLCVKMVQQSCIQNRFLQFLSPSDLMISCLVYFLDGVMRLVPVLRFWVSLAYPRFPLRISAGHQVCRVPTYLMRKMTSITSWKSFFFPAFSNDRKSIIIIR